MTGDENREGEKGDRDSQIDRPVSPAKPPSTADTEEHQQRASERPDEAGDEKSENRLHQLLRELSVSDWLTFFVAVASLLIGIGSLVVSYWTYRTAADTKEINEAIARLADLAAQTKRSANAAENQIGMLQNGLNENRKQTAALGRQALAGERSAKANSDQASAAISALDLQRSSLEFSFRPRIVVDPVSVGPLQVTGEKLSASFTFTLRNRGNLTANYVEYSADLWPLQTAVEHQADVCRETDLLGNTVARQKRDKTLTGGYDAIAPDETSPAKLTFNFGDTLSRFRIRDQLGRIPNYIPLALVGCLSYKSSSGDRVRHTRFLYEVSERTADGESSNFISADPHVIEAGRVKISRWPAGNSDD